MSPRLVYTDFRDSIKELYGTFQDATKATYPLRKITAVNHYMAGNPNVDNTKDSSIGAIHAFLKFEAQEKTFWIGLTPSRPPIQPFDFLLNLLPPYIESFCGPSLPTPTMSPRHPLICPPSPLHRS